MKQSLAPSALALALAFALVVPMPTAAQQPGQQQPSGQPQGVQIQGSSLMGSTVRSSDGKDLGKVSDVLIDPHDGRVASVIVSMGGTLGMGAKEMVVPWNAVRVGRDQQKVVLTLQQQVMPPAPKAQGDQRGSDQSSPAASPSTGQNQSQQQQPQQQGQPAPAPQPPR